MHPSCLRDAFPEKAYLMLHLLMALPSNHPRLNCQPDTPHLTSPPSLPHLLQEKCLQNITTFDFRQFCPTFAKDGCPLVQRSYRNYNNKKQYFTEITDTSTDYRLQYL